MRFLSSFQFWQVCCEPLSWYYMEKNITREFNLGGDKKSLGIRCKDLVLCHHLG